MSLNPMALRKMTGQVALKVIEQIYKELAELASNPAGLTTFEFELLKKIAENVPDTCAGGAEKELVE